MFRTLPFQGEEDSSSRSTTRYLRLIAGIYPFEALCKISEIEHTMQTAVDLAERLLTIITFAAKRCSLALCYFLHFLLLALMLPSLQTNCWLLLQCDRPPLAPAHGFLPRA